MRMLLAIALALMAVGAMGQGMKAETKAEKDKRMDWWREARLGMFIHWGLYSIPAGQYGGKNGYGEWIREEAHIPVGEYEKYKDQFNPVNFNADEWVKMAHDAGMKYITITTKHHDGFNLFNSPYTDWDVMSTPFKRDIMAEMAAACKKYGVKMCWYHSIMDWHHPDYLPRRTWEVGQRPADGADFRKFVEYLRNEVAYLLTHYGPIGVMWFDGEWESTWNPKDGDALYELCRTVQPDVIVNNRVTVGRAGMDGTSSAGDFNTPEQYIPATGLGNVDWETCMTMNAHWGYNSHDTAWKSSKELIQNIVDIASKGGNYLLNIGPRSDGTFPPEAVDRLKDIGAWMKVNSNAIYDTKASVFDKLPWGRSTTKYYDRNSNIATLFLHVFDWPKDGKLVVPGIGNNPGATHVLGKGNAVKVERVGSDLVINVGKVAPDPICSVVRLDIFGAPVIYKAPLISSASPILVDSTTATIDSGSKALMVRYTANGLEPTLASSQYVGPISVTEGMTLKAAAFHNGKRVSSVATMTFKKVTPKPASDAVKTQPGLLCEEYKGSFDKLPDFASIKPRDSFALGGVSLKLKDGLTESAEENWARRLSGNIVVPADGVYEFVLTSDDGSRLWIDGELVVDNDGLHGSTAKSGVVALAKGQHSIVVGWFNKSGGLELSLAWAKAGSKLRMVDAGSLKH
jgi:alpha-L-fucosidase